jgi:hypothetical protein
MTTFTLATYGTESDYSWTTEGWIPSQVPADTNAAELAAQIAEQATEYRDMSEVDADELAWEVAAIARHIQAWLDENQADLMQEVAAQPALTLESIAAQIDPTTAFEANYSHDGAYTVMIQQDADGEYTATYFLRGEVTDAEEYAALAELIEAMPAMNENPAAWQRWELVNGEWETPAQVAEVMEVQPEAEAQVSPAINWELVAKTLYWRSDDIAGTDFILRTILGLDPEIMIDKK